jgi:hypothetical protein
MSDDRDRDAFEAGHGEIQDFILARELAEVYLLLDNISSAKAKSIPADGGHPIFKNKSGKAWLEQVCDIAWPPEPSNRDSDALNAAKLIRAKDMLNQAAAPATGASIAFTLTVVGESTGAESGRPWWRRLLLRLGGVSPPAVSASGSGPGGGNGGWRKPPTRASLAALAYPTFAHRAWRYRVAFFSLIIFLIVWLVITCAVSWDVATGSALLNRVNALESARLATTAPSPATSPPATSSQARRPRGPLIQPAQPTMQPPSQVQAAPPDAVASAQPRNDDRHKAAARNLATWVESPNWLRRLLVGGMGGRAEEATIVDDAGAPQTNVEWAAAFIGVLAGTILPIFYGLLGAAAAVVRSVSAKLRDSTLMPRDLGLAYVQLALGAVIGACVGLFVTPDGASGSGQGLLGSVHLSAPALCFVGGFGVEGVFLALESLIRRVFNIDQPKPTAP